MIVFISKEIIFTNLKNKSVMKKGILTIVIGFIGVAIFAQKENTSKQFKDVIDRPMKPIVLRMTDNMNNDDIGLELINNFYKIELSDVTTNEKIYSSESQNRSFNEFDLNAKDNNDASNYNIILDLAVRTTNEMRSSIYSEEEFVG